jgi:hypothetical protein
MLNNTIKSTFKDAAKKLIRLMIQPSLLFWSISPWHFGDPK